MARKTLLTLVSVIVSMGFLGGWYYAQPAEGSGWLLFVAVLFALVISTLILLDGINSCSSKKPARRNRDNLLS